MEEQKRVPKLRFAEFSGEWDNKNLGELLHFKNGLNASKENYGKGYKFINVLDIIENTVIKYDNIIGSVNVTEKEFLQNLVEYGDVLFQRSSETREEVGQSNVYLDKDKKATFGGFVIRGKKIGVYEPYFLHSSLKTSHARKEITSKSGGSTRYNVGQDTLASVNLLFPSLPEQQKISAFLSSVDKKITQLQQKKSLLENYKQGAMQQLFSQKLRFTREDGSAYPDWQEKRLGEVATITTGSSNRVDSGLDCKYTFFDRSQDIRTSNIYLFDGEAVIVAGEGQEFIPKYFVGKFDLHQRTYAIMNFQKSNGKFLYYLIQKNRHYFYSQAVGSTVKSLRLPMFQKMKVKLPVLEEQTQIAEFLSAIDTKIAVVQTQIEHTQQFKKGLLQQLFV